MAIILSINAGSSSVKVSVYRAQGQGNDPEQVAEAQLSGLTAPPAALDYEQGNKKVKGEEVKDADIKTQADAFQYLLKYIENDEDLKGVAGRKNITHICHRVVHGGDYPNAHEITRETYQHLEKLTDLAPLHNSAALGIVREAHELLPHAKNLAVFDSSFHRTIPEHIRTYAIDQDVARKNGLQKYGFHGISYSFIARTVAEHLRKPLKELNIIALHLGSGASACCIKNGESLDTTMGLTPVDGLPGATRSGQIDPSLVFHFTHDAGKPSQSATKELHITNAEEILNKKSGWKALAGTTDFGKISSSDDAGARLAFNLFKDRILGYIGSYYLKLHGKVDALVFAGGIGEKGDRLRAEIVEQCKCIGFELDGDKNSKKLEQLVADLSAQGARHQTLVVQTDEQWEMARIVTQDEGLFKMNIQT